MTTATAAEPTLTDIARRWGPIPLRRVRLHPFPATVDDVVELHDRHDRLFELVDGILVEKEVGYPSGFAATTILVLLRTFVAPGR